MPKLDPHLQITLDKNNLSEILKSYNLKLLSFKIAKGGIENTTAIVETGQGKYALRVYRKNKKSPRSINQELDFMEFLSGHELPVPKIYKNTRGQRITNYQAKKNNWKSLLMELMPGTHPKSYSPSLLKNMATAQALMHVLGTNFAKAQPKTKKLKVVKENQFIKKIDIKGIKKSAVFSTLQEIKNFTVTFPTNIPHSFNHLDFDHANILVNKNTLMGILDFDDLTYSPSVLCLGYTLWDIFYITNEIKNIKLYLKQYSKVRKITKLEINYLKNILLFRNYQIFAFDVHFWGENSGYLKKLLVLEKVFQKINLDF